MVEIEKTFAEAFEAWYSRVLITAVNEKWARIAATEATGYATSMIGCDAEAGIDVFIPAEKTPDNRPGYAIQIWSSKKKIKEALLYRLAQCVLTSPTASIWNLTESDEKLDIGYKLKYYGDGYERELELYGRKVIAIPIMLGEFIVERDIGIAKGIAGGNFIILAKDVATALKAGEKAVEAISKIEGVITPFPGGLCSAGSKVGSKKYKFMRATTNEKFCPTLANVVKDSKVKDMGAAIEVVINGINEKKVREAMKHGIEACLNEEGVKKITAGNYGGSLGKVLIHLESII